MALVERVTTLIRADFTELIEHANNRRRSSGRSFWLRLNIHLFCADITQKKSGN